MPKQVLELYDYLGPLAVAAIFAVVVFFFSFFVFNFFFIQKTDDFTVFERLGAKHNIRLGPHSVSQVQRGVREKRCKRSLQAEIFEESAEAQRQCTVNKQKIPIVKVDAASNS